MKRLVLFSLHTGNIVKIPNVIKELGHPWFSIRRYWRRWVELVPWSGNPKMPLTKAAATLHWGRKETHGTWVRQDLDLVRRSTSEFNQFCLLFVADQINMKQRSAVTSRLVRSLILFFFLDGRRFAGANIGHSIASEFICDQFSWILLIGIPIDGTDYRS